MKVWVFTSAAHFEDEPTDIMNVQVFTDKSFAYDYFNAVVNDHISEEGGWTLFSRTGSKVKLTDGDDEYVASMEEHEI